MNPVILEAAGARLHGRLTGFRDGAACFAGDLEASLEFGLGFERRLRTRFDEHAAGGGPRPSRARAGRVAGAARSGRPSCRSGGGDRHDHVRQRLPAAFGWIDLPLFDELGFPRTDRGDVGGAGPGFVGLPWMVTRRSPLLIGVGRDAGHVAGAVAEHLHG